MWLLITFITLWALTPGPVFIMTIQEARKHGSRRGVALSSGATATSVIMVLIALLIHFTGFMTFDESSSMFFVERIGSIGIILMGLFAGYKCMFANATDPVEGEQSYTTTGFIKGMCLMATNIPQALIFYTVIMPQTVETSEMTATIIGLGTLKVIMIFGFHAIVALIAGRSKNLTSNRRVKTVFDFALAALIVGMGVNMLIG
ncbi:MAG: LysE family translocator [Anaerolineae bacterium]